MDVVKVELEASKETYELCEGIGAVTKAVKEALADGWQPGTDMPAIITAAITNLVPAMQGVEKIPAEVKHTREFANAVYAGLTPVIFELAK